MKPTSNAFLKGFEKTAGRVESFLKNSVKGHSKRGLKAMMKRRGILVGSALG